MKRLKIHMSKYPIHFFQEALTSMYPIKKAIKSELRVDMANGSSIIFIDEGNSERLRGIYIDELEYVGVYGEVEANG